MKIKSENSVRKSVSVVMNLSKFMVVDGGTNLMESYCTRATKNLTFNDRDIMVLKKHHIILIF